LAQRHKRVIRKEGYMPAKKTARKKAPAKARKKTTTRKAAKKR